MNLLTAEELAAELSVPVSWVRGRTHRRLIPHYKIGKYARYSLEEVLAASKVCSGNVRSSRIQNINQDNRLYEDLPDVAGQNAPGLHLIKD